LIEIPINLYVFLVLTARVFLPKDIFAQSDGNNLVAQVPEIEFLQGTLLSFDVSHL
jgi:hypothetical protein